MHSRKHIIQKVGFDFEMKYFRKIDKQRDYNWILGPNSFGL